METVTVSPKFQMVIPKSVRNALSAAKLSGDLHIPMADSMILATARAFEVELWTQDADLNGIEKVKYIEKK